MKHRFSLSILSTIAGALTAVVGLLVLIGWQFDIAILKSPLPGAVSMKANTAAAFLLAGLALILLQRSSYTAKALVRLCAVMIAMVGFLSLCHHLFGWDLGINDILFREPPGAIATSYPGLMAPNTALNFLLLGFAFFVLTYQRIRSSFLIEFPLVFAISISVIGFVGYVTGLVELAGPAAYTKMAIHTAAAFIVLCIGMIFTAYERQHSPIMIEQKLFAGLTAAAAVIIFISILSLSSIQSLLQAGNWVKHTQQVKNQIGAVLAHVIEVQSGDRGFILTGDDNFLVVYNRALDEFPTLLNNLRSPIADNPRQQKSFASLEKLVEERVAFSNRLVSTRMTKGEAEARLLFATNRGRMLTDSIRVLVARMIAEEDQLLQTRSEDETRQANRNQLITYLSLAVQVLLLAFIFLLVNKDIVGRRKAEKKLEKLNEELEDRVKERTASLLKSEERYRSTLENLMEGCQIIDFDYRYLYINDVAAKQGRCTKEESLGHTMMERYPGIEKSQMFSKLRKCMMERVHQEMENEFIYPDGSKAWFNLHMEPVPEGVFILSIDITERKRAELLQNAVYRIFQETDKTETLDDLYKSIHYIVKTVMRAENFYIALFDEEKDLISFPYFVDEVDVPSPPVKPGKGLTEYVLRTGKSLLCDEATDTRLSQQGEIELIGALSAIWLGTPLIVGTKTIGVMVVQDYNDPKVYGEHELHMMEYVSSQVAKAIQHKRAEEKLRHSEEQFRLISENVADLIAVLDLEGRRVYSSPSYKNILGDPEALRGTDSFREIHPEDREKIKSIFQETIKTGIGQRAEYRFFKPDGKIVYIESQGSVIRVKKGKITNVVVVSRDVTEKKLLEQQFLRTQRLESIGTLAGGIAHDLNNVLAPILLSVEYLRKIIKDENGKRMLDALESSAKRGADIIKQVLTFAHGTEGEKGIIQLKHLISEMVNIIKETFPRLIRLDLKIAKDLWTIEGNATNLHQVLLNLCVNARDAMPNGGKLKLAAENFEIDESMAKIHIDAKPGRYVILSVTDTGTGIPKEIIDKIYDPFFTTKAVGKGTGLGLSTVHAIVKSHGGFINVYSEAGNGTTFKTYLPAAELGQTEKSGSKGKELITGNGELILVIDDELSICEITNEILEMFGYRVLTASNGAEGLVIFKSRAKDITLVITDMMMPIMDGPQTIRELRKINPAVKIILSSGLMEKDDTDKGIEHIADGLIAKPYTAEKLLEVIHSVLHKGS
ncbi:MAG: CHASE3 domain-containing protein [Bacteroidota bacterium]|nr:CHASE3 domain-containing protein [Bacteroidota bacterium]